MSGSPRGSTNSTSVLEPPGRRRHENLVRDRDRAYLKRAATYYATALYLIEHASDPSRRQELWTRQRGLGPGQQAALFEQGIPFRHDWEAVLGPVLDVLVARPDVAADRIAAIGISQAGYWVPRALAFEHRFAAAVADPGVVDVSTSWTDQLPGFMRAQLEDPGKRDAFDKEMSWTERLSKSTRATLHFRGEPYGLESDSRYDLYQEVLKYRLGDEVARITTPLLITSPEDEQFWPGQSQALYDRLTGPKELVAFSAHEGANRHCEPMGLGLREARLFSWLDRHLA